MNPDDGVADKDDREYYLFWFGSYAALTQGIIHKDPDAFSRVIFRHIF